MTHPISETQDAQLIWLNNYQLETKEKKEKKERELQR